jgi:hypothetical protein
MNPSCVAADIRRLKLLEQNDIRASLRRLLRFMGSRREISFRGILSLLPASCPPGVPASRRPHARSTEVPGSIKVNAT